ncbi:MAG TPA: hypothetical protein DCE55_09570 [Planctomycetaceae bacterium]|nr:hypothetical protein [Planctomycetaceae bacterium]
MDQILAPVAANFSEPHRRPGTPMAVHLPPLLRIGFQRVIKKTALVRPAMLPDDDAVTPANSVGRKVQRVAAPLFDNHLVAAGRVGFSGITYNHRHVSMPLTLAQIDNVVILGTIDRQLPQRRLHPVDAILTLGIAYVVSGGSRQQRAIGA